MTILSIDTTGFSTSVAIVENGQRVLYNKIYSHQITAKRWADYPVLLPQMHQKFLIKELRKIIWDNIDGIAVSAGSGIVNCIIVGHSIGLAYANIYKKPIFEADHVLAHIYSTWIERDIDDLEFPYLVFSASGSHSDIALVEDKNSCRIINGAISLEKSGMTRKYLGVGKIFYKIGKELGLISGSDMKIDRFISAASKGDPCKYDFAKFYKGSLSDLNFAQFSESVQKFLSKEKTRIKALSHKNISDIAASFQESFTSILAGKIIKIAETEEAKEIHITGGIAMNEHLEKKIKQKIKQINLPQIVRYPAKKEYCLDNAAMIGTLAFYQKEYKIKFKNFKANITY